MTAEPAGPPSFEDVLARGQEFLAQLGALYQGMAREQADQKAELEAMRGAQQQWTAERTRLLKDAERLRKEGEVLRADNVALKASQKSYESQLAQLQEQSEQLGTLHAHVTEQTAKLAADWSARREALAGDNQRLTAEIAQVRGTLDLSLDREKQWKAQVWKLQDAVKTLRGAAGLVSLTAEQSHHLASQLNAITGFAEVLLDEAGNRTTGDERQEFLQHIKESGAHLADYVRQLGMGPKDESTPQTADIPAPVEAPHSPAPTVLVAATDPAQRERVESFLRRDGYQIEYAGTGEEALEMAARLQPLAMMIDAELSPSGGQELIDQLAGEARTKDIPVVLLARSDQEQPARASVDTTS